MHKRGFQFSFAMIFSIILIIAIVAFSFYVISYFLGLGEATDIALFYQDFQDEINRAWNSEITRDVFTGNLPSGIESVCFGNLTQSGSGKEYEDLRRYRRQNANTFLYPPGKAQDQAFAIIEHLDFSGLQGFSCFPVEERKVKIRIEKGSFDKFVKISRG
jgi:hypothetical protein